MRKCLLLKTEDKRKFLIWKKDLKHILKFAKTVKLTIFEAELKDKAKVLDAKQLATEFCNPNYKYEPPVNVLDKIFPRPKKNRKAMQKDRKSMLDDAKQIQQSIRDSFLKGTTVSLKALQEKYKDYSLSYTCLCNHLSSVRKQLVKEGKTISKVGAGKYVMS